MIKILRVSKLLGFLTATLLSAAVNAGPPLICHPFMTGNDPLLPWTENVNNWYSPDRHYNIEHLTGDALRLLTPDAPVLSRMENLRRAALYASNDSRIAVELLTAVVARTGHATDPHSAALALFDTGYLIETYRQLGHVRKTDPLANFASRATPAAAAQVAQLDPRALVRRAQALAPELTAELEFALSLMADNNRDAARHRDLAAARAPAGSLLAQNLAHWN